MLDIRDKHKLEFRPDQKAKGLGHSEKRGEDLIGRKEGCGRFVAGSRPFWIKVGLQASRKKSLDPGAGLRTIAAGAPPRKGDRGGAESHGEDGRLCISPKSI